MKKGRSRGNGRLSFKLKENEKIVLYKKGSRGDIIAEYLSVTDIVDSEKMFNKFFRYSNVDKALTGTSKSFASFKHQCRVVPKVRLIK